LEHISQFSTDIRHIEGKSNVVADALSKVETIQEAFEALAKSQKEDEEMRQYKTGKLGLKLKKVPIQHNNYTVTRQLKQREHT